VFERHIQRTAQVARTSTFSGIISRKQNPGRAFAGKHGRKPARRSWRPARSIPRSHQERVYPRPSRFPSVTMWPAALPTAIASHGRGPRARPAKTEAIFRERNVAWVGMANNETTAWANASACPIERALREHSRRPPSMPREFPVTEARRRSAVSAPLPPTGANREPILAMLERNLPPRALVPGNPPAGTGQHVAQLRNALPALERGSRATRIEILPSRVESGRGRKASQFRPAGVSTRCPRSKHGRERDTTRCCAPRKNMIPHLPALGRPLMRLLRGAKECAARVGRDCWCSRAVPAAGFRAPPRPTSTAAFDAPVCCRTRRTPAVGHSRCPRAVGCAGRRGRIWLTETRLRIAGDKLGVRACRRKGLSPFGRPRNM